MTNNSTEAIAKLQAALRTENQRARAYLIEEALEILTATPTQQPSGEVTFPAWISVDERLPEEGEAIAFVVHWPGDEFLHGRVLGGTFHSYGGKMPTFSVPGTGFKATYWMPLPTAPADAARAQGGKS